MQRLVMEVISFYNQADASGWRRSPICPCFNKACIGGIVPCFCDECKSWRTAMGFRG